MQFLYSFCVVQKLEGSDAINIDMESQRFHFAVTGKSWGVIRKFQPELLTKVGCWLLVVAT
jgi:hypothetical protein